MVRCHRPPKLCLAEKLPNSIHWENFLCEKNLPNTFQPWKLLTEVFSLDTNRIQMFTYLDHKAAHVFTDSEFFFR